MQIIYINKKHTINIFWLVSLDFNHSEAFLFSKVNPIKTINLYENFVIPWWFN